MYRLLLLSALAILLAAPTSASAAYAGAMLRALPSEAETTSPAYSRDRFNHWTDADRDGCDTRYEVLYRQNTRRGEGGCSSRAGRWRSAYDGQVFGHASRLDVDHVIPLAEAWRSGAATQWDANTRERFANDLGYRPSLLAVSASSNRSKGDRDPAEWMPPLARFHCRYAVNWVAVKYRWRLAVDTAERAALRTEMKGCPAAVIRLPSAPPRAVITNARPVAPGDGGGGGIPMQPDQAGDQDCSDMEGPVRVLPGDPDRLDNDGDGIGCE